MNTDERGCVWKYSVDICQSGGKPNKTLVAIYLAPVVQRLDNAIHQINHYPADSVVCFVNTYPLDRDLSGG